MRGELEDTHFLDLNTELIERELERVPTEVLGDQERLQRDGREGQEGVGQTHGQRAEGSSGVAADDPDRDADSGRYDRHRQSKPQR